MNDSADPPFHYNESSHKFGSDRPDEHNSERLAYFDQIARKLVQEIRPQSVLDAGCTNGMLVEALRRYGVEAWGVCVSEVAASSIPEEVRPFCWVGSNLDRFPRSYDLIICLEETEYLPNVQSEAVIENLCRHTDDILFSSIPPDYREVTHLNVQPPEYWAEQFALSGFFRDVDFDASWIDSWAGRFRKIDQPVHRMVREYEHRYWQLWKKNQNLEELSNDLREEASGRETQIQDLQAHLNALVNSRSWRALQKLQSIRLKLAPLGSKREHLIKRILGRFLGRQTISAAPPEGDHYPSWAASREPSLSVLEFQRGQSESFRSRPLISIITPVYNPPPDVLRSTLESVLAQTYSNWELCLADASEGTSGIRNLLQEYAARDERIQVQNLKENLGISGNSNAALHNAKGDFILLLDHDDQISPSLLFEVVQVLDQEQDADLIYYDEDKLDADGLTRRNPFFKPDWSPEMLLSANYLTHPVIRRSLVDEVGPFNPDYDGTQDWDLVFRCTEKARRIIHIPKVLYHWREVGGSTAGVFTAKPWVFERQLRCINAHLERTGRSNASSQFVRNGIIRVVWPFKPVRVSIIIPNKDQPQLISRFLDLLFRQTRYPDYEVILVDTGSTNPETFAYYNKLADDSRIHLIKFQGPFNFSAACNLGAKSATGKLLLFLNNDIEVLDGDWLEEMAQWALQREIGIVGAKLLFPNQTIQHAGIILGLNGHADHLFLGMPEGCGGIFGSSDWYRNVLAVTGACLMMRRDVYDEVGGWDETYRLVYSDVSLCLSVIKAGHRVLYNPFIRLIHHQGSSRGSYMPVEDMRKAYEDFKPFINAGDPFFNPNLSYASAKPDLSGQREPNRMKRVEDFISAAEASQTNFTSA